MESAGAAPSADRRTSVPPGASVLVKGGFYDGLELPLDLAKLVIGRGRCADVMLAEPTISRAHAALGYTAEGFYVEDLGSTNGTLVNGKKASRSVLRHGDEIQMGRLVLRVALPESRAA